MTQYSVADAKSHLSQILREAEGGTEIEITRRGRPVAILLGTGRYEELTSGRSGFSNRYRLFREEHDLASLEIDPDEIFPRESSPGREFRW